MTDKFGTWRLTEVPEVVAPDGSAVRPLGAFGDMASFAHFELAPGQVSTAVTHRTVQEIWYVIDGTGEMWRSQDGREEVAELSTGVCVTIPLGTAFQFRAGEDGLRVVAVTAPSWPVGVDEAIVTDGPWQAG